jgi:hypothetical protein
MNMGGGGANKCILCGPPLPGTPHTVFLQVPQFILEAAQSAGQLHNIKIVAAQPRRLITTGGTSAALAPELLRSSASTVTAAELLLNST